MNEPLPAPADDRVGRSLQDAAEFRHLSDAAGCLMPLLSALNWHGERREIAEAAPHFADGLDIGDLRKILAELKYATRHRQMRMGDIDPRLLPCLFAPEGDPLVVVLSADDNGGYQVLNGATGQIETINNDPPGDAYLISEITEEPVTEQQPWSAGLLARFRPFLWKIFVITGLTSVLALTIPIFIKTLYDRVIPAQSLGTLFFIGVGMLVVLTSEATLRLLRARLIAFIGGRTDLIVGSSSLNQILRIPVSMTERTSIGAQVAGLQQFEVLRESFVGPLAAVLFELPFVLLAIALIAVLAGPIAWIPAALAVVFVVMAMVAYPNLRRLNRTMSKVASQRNEFLMETVANLRSIKDAGANDIWAERHRDLSAASAKANYDVTRANAVLQTVSQQLMMMAGIAILAWGAVRVMNASMTIGSLIAIMALSWRVLGPLQSALVNLSKLNQVLGGLRQLDRLMSLPREKEPSGVYNHTRRFQGQVTFDRVSMRYVPDGNPALLGVSFAAEPGELIAITGASGSGKSTVARLLLGLYTPQGGAVSLDGIDIRQLDVCELRNAIAYMPQETQIFHGTVAQNLRLANPVASEDELIAAAKQAHVWAEIEALPDGLNTRLTEGAQSRYAAGFLRKLSLAQTYLKGGSIFLLDEPSSSIDHEDDRAFMESIAELRGKATVILVTQRPSHVRMADKVLVLQNGGAVFWGTPEELAERTAA